MSYWDTGCLVKLYAPEPNSMIFRQHASNLAGPLITGDFTRLELWTALRRKETELVLASGEAAQLLATFDQDAQNGVVKVTPLSARIAAEFERAVERCLSQTPPIFIRTLDALHIAMAREASETEMVSTDKRLRDAAMLFGLTLFPLASSLP